jgi:hypothetical protein
VVPFAEARSRVAREVAHQIGDPAAVLDAWMDSVGQRVTVSDEGLAAASGPDPDDGTTLARWPGGALTLGEYVGWGASQPAAWHAGGRGTDPARFRASVAALARRRLALDEAGRRNLDVPAGERAKMERAWADTVYQWSASMGFAYGMTPGSIVQAARKALGDPGQQAGLVRAAIDERAPLLEARYEIEVGTAGETGTGRQP